jgi:hypothetical protein
MTGKQAKTYAQPSSPGGRMCTRQCRNAHEHCRDNCLFKERQCAMDIQSQAIRDYEDYVREQFKMRGEVDLKPSDFEQLDKCAQPRCLSQCEDIYDTCFENCGGSIQNR